jgi:ATP-dependent Clp protease ATP-binding subunit ClpC
MDDEGIPAGLTAGAARLVEAAEEIRLAEHHDRLGVNHWFLALLQRYGPMAESLAQGLQAPVVRGRLYDDLRRGTTGEALDRATVLSRASQRAQASGRTQVAEADLATVILMAAGFPLVEAVAPGGDEDGRAPDSGVGGGGATTPASPGPVSPPPPGQRPTPVLEQFGRDLTRAAREGKLTPVVGREQEVQLVIEALCRRTKRNPVLVGPAGVGKTAIVEGLAQRMARGEVPELLRGARLFAVQPSSLTAGAGVVGELEKRVRALLAEASGDGILLFIDELHSVIGAGGPAGTGDIASLLKPALARGDVACIAATTDDEYRRFIEPDAALERRFLPVRVQELTVEQMVDVLAALRDDLAAARGVEVGDKVLRWIIDFAAREMRNRRFPDKAVDVLEQCVAFAVAAGKKGLDLADAQAVARRMVGMPVISDEQRATLRTELEQRGLLRAEEAGELEERLDVTMRGLDLYPARPNAVVLLIGEAAAQSEAVGRQIAGTLLGSPDRVVAIDFSAFTQPHDVAMLIGSPPGYVGYSESTPLHRVAQMPWCVLRCENVHACHPQILQVLTAALDQGSFTDARGKHIYVSDAVVLLTAAIAAGARRAPGFLPRDHESVPDGRRAAEAALGAELLRQVDVVCAGVPASGTAERQWVREHLLRDLTQRYYAQGVALDWDESFVDWVVSQQSGAAGQRQLERELGGRLGRLLVRHLSGSEDAARGKEVKTLRISSQDGEIRVDDQH